MNALFSFVPPNERVIVVEETPEIRLPHKHVVKLTAVREQGIGMQHLIVESLRMRPDRIIVGEVRSREEVGAFIDTLLAGQGKGSYATFHSQSSQEAIKRMAGLGVMPMDLCSIDLVVVQRRWNRIDAKSGASAEVRRATEISELLGEDGAVKVNRLFEFDYARDRLVRANRSVAVMEKAKRAFSFGDACFEKEAGRREGALRGLLERKMELGGFFAEIHRGGKFSG
jgi:Flp pilus assembly CpaF family ATPase